MRFLAFRGIGLPGAGVGVIAVWELGQDSPYGIQGLQLNARLWLTRGRP